MYELISAFATQKLLSFWKPISPRILHPKSQKFYHLVGFTSSLSFSSNICAKSYVNEDKCKQWRQQRFAYTEGKYAIGNLWFSPFMLANSIYEVCLQGIMVVVFIILDWIFVFIQKNYHDFRQAHLKDGIGHSKFKEHYFVELGRSFFCF